ncbi:MAG: MCE family protein [candidate division Zixibacteria bacterium]|nr:MCE family protein [candidate division Zixibacteria bacterium]
MTREVKVGLTIILASLFLVIAVFTIGDQEGVWKSKYQLRLKYDDVIGLLPGSPVRLSGLRVGTVKEIYFSETDPGRLEVKLSIDKSVQRFIRSDSRALIGTMGLLGDKTIEISSGSDTARVLNEDEYLLPGRSSSIEAIIAEGGQAVENIREASRHAKEIIEKINNGTGSLGLFVNDPNVYFDLDKLLVLTERLTQQLESGTGSFAKFITDSTLYVEMRSLMSNTNVLLDSLSHGDGTLAQLLHDPEPYNDLKTIVADWRKITTRINSGEGALGQMLYNDTLYYNLSRTLDRAEALLEDFRLNPGRYLKLRIF